MLWTEGCSQYVQGLTNTLLVFLMYVALGYIVHLFGYISNLERGQRIVGKEIENGKEVDQESTYVLH